MNCSAHPLSKLVPPGKLGRARPGARAVGVSDGVHGTTIRSFVCLLQSDNLTNCGIDALVGSSRVSWSLPIPGRQSPRWRCCPGFHQDRLGVRHDLPDAVVHLPVAHEVAVVGVRCLDPVQETGNRRRIQCSVPTEIRAPRQVPIRLSAPPPSSAEHPRRRLRTCSPRIQARAEVRDEHPAAATRPLLRLRVGLRPRLSRQRGCFPCMRPPRAL